MNSGSKKILTLKELAKICESHRKNGDKIVLCHGAFDLLHPGHIRHFESAKNHGDVLVVTITSDKFIKKGPGRPVFNEFLRAESLAALAIINYVAIVNADSAIDAIKNIKPHFYVKGPDYKNRIPNPKIPRKLDREKKAVIDNGGELIFTDDEIIFSSSGLINAHFENFPEKTREFFINLKSQFPIDKIINKLADLRELKIMVIGDTIIDQYVYCSAMGKSYKEPLVVHKYLSEESFIGGVLATANHAASLSDQITVVTMLGEKKSYLPFIKKKLRKTIKPVFFFHKDAFTVVKRRYIESYTKQKVFQVTYFKDELISKHEEAAIVKYLNKHIGKFDLVLVNDFGQGMFTQKIVDLICNKAKYLALNVQANSTNYGFNIITKYPRADFVCIDEQEIRLATHDKYSDLQTLIPRLNKHMHCKEMIITRGIYGSLTYLSQNNHLFETPACATSAVDRVGAGDALFAVSSPCAYSGMERELVSFIGNVAGALQVQTVGNRDQINFLELKNYIARLLK